MTAQESGGVLAGRTALVTGASSGLGRRFATVLAAEGAQVVAAARRGDLLDALVQEVSSSGGAIVAAPMDAIDPASIEAAVARAEEAFGPVQILVNNAALGEGRPAIELPLADLDQMLSVNLRGPWLLSCAVARRLIAAGLPGRIINIASSAAFDHRGKGGAFYSVTKAAMVRMTETLGLEWAAAGINVNAIAPGVFDTEMVRPFAARIDQFVQATPRQRIGRPDQLDGLLLFLASDASEFVTGAVIIADDGQGAR